MSSCDGCMYCINGWCDLPYKGQYDNGLCTLYHSGGSEEGWGPSVPHIVIATDLWAESDRKGY